MKSLNSNLFDKKSILPSDGMNKIYGGLGTSGETPIDEKAKTKWKSSSGSSGTDTSTDGGKDAEA